MYLLTKLLSRVSSGFTNVLRIAIACTLASVTLASCSSQSGLVDKSLMPSCILLDEPDQYRVGVLMVIGAAKNNPEIVEQGKGNPFNYIDSTVRKSVFPDVTDSKESIYIRNTFADALDQFAAAYLAENETSQREASINLDLVAEELKQRCISLGMDYSQLANN